MSHAVTANADLPNLLKVHQQVSPGLENLGNDGQIFQTWKIYAKSGQMVNCLGEKIKFPFFLLEPAYFWSQSYQIYKIT